MRPYDIHDSRSGLGPRLVTPLPESNNTYVEEHIFDMQIAAIAKETDHLNMPFSAATLKSVPQWFQALLPRIMSQQSMARPARESEVPRGPTTLKRTEKLRESLKTTKTRKSKNGTVSLDLRSTPFFRLSDQEALRMFGDAFGPELDHLKNAKASVEANATQTALGSIGPDGLSPSRFLFGEDFSEVNRTLIGVLALKWIVNDHYETFTAFQSNADRLTRASWGRLRSLFEEHLRSDGEAYALLVATIVNDLGKDPALVASIVARHMAPNAPAPNHDRVIYEAALAHEIDVLNEFKATPGLHEDLLAGLALGATLNVGQLAQAENVPGSLHVVRELRPDPHAFALKYLEILLDVAGAMGSADARGAPIFTEVLFGTYEHARTGVERLVQDPQTPLRGAYDCVLQERAAVVRAAGFDSVLHQSVHAIKPSLDTADPTGRAFLRLLCITRSFDAKQAYRVQSAFSSLPPETRTALVDGLSVDGDEDGTAILPYYAPALFHNALRTVSDEPRRERAFAAIMRLLARVYRGTKPEPGKSGRVVECDLSVAQDATKGAKEDAIGKRFADDPDVLDELEIPLSRYNEEL